MTTLKAPPQPASRTNNIARPSNVFAALFWMAVALGSFTLVAISGRAAGQSMDTMHLMFYRSAIGLIIISLIIMASPAGLAQIKTRRLGLHTVRNSVHFFAQYCWLYALMLIPLAQLFAIEFTAPLWVALLAPFLLGERLTLVRVIAAMLGFSGILVIVQPATVPVSTGTLYALTAALGFAGSMIATKLLVRTETIFCFLFHMSWMQLVIAGIFVFQDFKIPSFETSQWITALGVTGMMAHFALARAFTHADAIIVAPMDFLRLPLIMTVGLVLYNEPIEQTVLIGAGIVVAANLFNMFGERSRRT